MSSHAVFFGVGLPDYFRHIHKSPEASFRYRAVGFRAGLHNRATYALIILVHIFVKRLEALHFNDVN